MSPTKLCLRGHALTQENSVYNSEGFRECRLCRYARNNRYRREIRNGLRVIKLLARLPLDKLA